MQYTYYVSLTRSLVFFPEQEAHAPGPSQEEDARHEEGPHPPRGLAQDQQGAEEGQGFPNEEVRCQGLNGPPSKYNKEIDYTKKAFIQ